MVNHLLFYTLYLTPAVPMFALVFLRLFKAGIAR
jgi:hypothetical protein